MTLVVTDILEAMYNYTPRRMRAVFRKEPNNIAYWSGFYINRVIQVNLNIKLEEALINFKTISNPSPRP